MTHFLWVEDFNFSEPKRGDNFVSSTVKSVFGSVLDEKELRERLKEEDEYDAQEFLEEKGILLKLNLLEALTFIRNPDELSKIDFVVLDVDMPLCRDGQSGDNNYLPSLIEQYESTDDLRKIAGYQIYTELVIELGFPKDHILFCSNHASYFDQLKGKFASANIKPPLSSNPDKPFLTKDDTVDIKQWLSDAHSDYFVLRRGIIEGCRYIVELIEESKLNTDNLIFNNFIPEPEKRITIDDMRDYVEVLENFLPLREPSNKASLYKLFIRTIAHEWEAADHKKIKGLAWVMKNTRNWIVHNSTLFSTLDEKMVAYLFIINMRLIFNFDEAVQPYEKILLDLFKEDALLEKTFNDKNKNDLIAQDLGKAYCYLQNIASEDKDEMGRKNIRDAFRFYALANNIQESNSLLRLDKKLFTKLLYQMFWLINSYPRIGAKNRTELKINFSPFVYKKNTYLFEIARHIYNASFLQ
jgi:hypothetical protein